MSRSLALNVTCDKCGNWDQIDFEDYEESGWMQVGESDFCPGCAETPAPDETGYRNE